MNYAIVNLKVDQKTKKEAQEVANEIGVPLSTLLKSYLKQLIRTRAVSFDVSEKPSEYLLETIRKSEEDLGKNEASPIFEDSQKAINWLHKQAK